MKKKKKKRKTITFLRRKLSKLDKKDTILHAKNIFFLKQEQTRTSSGPNWVPLNREKMKFTYGLLWHKV